MDRREFLIGFGKIAVAASVAPAIVKAENIMKVWTPPEKEIILPGEQQIMVGGCDLGILLGVGYNWKVIDAQGNLIKRGLGQRGGTVPFSPEPRFLISNGGCQVSKFIPDTMVAHFNWSKFNGKLNHGR